jgi:gliding motility-associated-like protein
MGDSLVVNSTPGYNDYSWIPSSISGNTDVYYPSSSSENLISLTITGEGGCTSSESLDIAVYDLPIVNLAIDNTEICIGESISLTTTAGYNNYDWSPSAISSDSDTYTPTSLDDNQISVTITSEGGCTSSDSVNITVFDLPIVGLSIDDTDLCMGDSLVVNSTPGYNDYSWIPSSISGNTDVYYPSSSSENLISLTITGEGGCTSSESLDIAVYDLPIVNLAIDNTEICIGESISLSTTAGYNNYDWSPSAISSDSDTYTPTSLDDNQVSVTITADGGCTSSDSVSVTIYDLPIVEVSLSDSVICLGESITVNSTSGFVNYEWTPTLINTSNVMTPLISETNYFVEVTDSNGCISNDDANLIINESTPISLSVNGSNATTICIGEEIDLFATPGFDLYTWSIASLSSNQGSYIPSDLSDNQFSVIGTNQFGCNSSASLNITINSIPTPSLISVFADSIQTSPQNINLCEGISNVKFSSIISSESNPVEWLFASGNGAVIESGQNTSELVVSFPEVEDYILEFREYGSENCYTPQQIEVKVNPKPVLDLTYVEDCYKDSVFFTNNSSVDTTIQSVSWLVDGLSFDSYDLVYPLDNNNKVFELTIVDVLNCSSSLSTSFVPSDRPYVDFYHEPEKITILDPEVSFVNLSSNGNNVSWSFGDNQISNEWEPIHTYDSLGWFEVVLKVQNDEGCADSISKQLLIENNLIYYFPSSFTPDGDGLNDDFGVSGFRTEKIQNYQFQITNRWGEIVFYSENINEKWDGKISKGNDAMPGSYLWSVRIVDELGKVTRKFGDFTLLR